MKHDLRKVLRIQAPNLQLVGSLLYESHWDYL